jgi:hypothetical protein
MKRQLATTPAQQIIRRISELRDLSRRLSQAGYRAGLHTNDPYQLPSSNRVAERCRVYSSRARPK